MPTSRILLFLLCPQPRHSRRSGSVWVHRLDAFRRQHTACMWTLLLRLFLLFAAIATSALLPHR